MEWSGVKWSGVEWSGMGLSEGVNKLGREIKVPQHCVADDPRQAHLLNVIRVRTTKDK